MQIYNKVSTTLAAAIDSDDTTITVASNSGFPQDDELGPYEFKIDGEAIRVNSGHGTNSWSVTRGFRNTTATTHSSSTAVEGGILSAEGLALWLCMWPGPKANSAAG